MKSQKHINGIKKPVLNRYELVTMHGQSSGYTFICRTLDEAIERFHPVDGESVEQISFTDTTER